MILRVGMALNSVNLWNFYKAEMPNFQDWTLDISELKILWIWDRAIQTTIK